MIAVLDSGIGGVSVLRELVRLLPGEDFYYFGDTARAPYGTKTKEEVLAIVRENVKALLSRGAVAIVLACNTATAAAAAALRAEYPEVPIIGIEPALKPATMVSPHPRVLSMATPLTLREEKYAALEARFAADAEIIDVPCPGLMELIEAGHLDDGVLDAYLDGLLLPYRGIPFDACVLGCTHYPHAKRAIARHLPESCVILDGGEGTARETARRLREAGLLSGRLSGGEVTFANSRGDAATDAFARRLLAQTND